MDSAGPGLHLDKSVPTYDLFSIDQSVTDRWGGSPQRSEIQAMVKDKLPLPIFTIYQGESPDFLKNLF